MNTIFKFLWKFKFVFLIGAVLLAVLLIAPEFLPQPGKIVENAMLKRTPMWSPTGDKIVFVSEYKGASGLWLLTFPYKNITQLTNSLSSDWFPSWSPDGKYVAFHSNRGGNLDIWTVRIEDGKLSQITNDPAPEVTPAWSPGGDKIAFSSMRHGG